MVCFVFSANGGSRLLEVHLIYIYTKNVESPLVLHLSFEVLEYL